MLTQARVGGECGSAQKLDRRKTLLPLELNLKQFEPGVSCASYEKTMAFDEDLARNGRDRRCRLWLGCV